MQEPIPSSDGALANAVERTVGKGRAAGRPGSGTLLALTATGLVFRLGAPDEEWANFVSAVLQAAILAAAVLSSRLSSSLTRAATALIAVFVAVALLCLLLPAVGVGTLLPVTACLVALAPPAIVYGAVRRLRAERRVTVDLVFAVLGIYLLLGFAFSLAFQLVADIEQGDFFAGGDPESPANTLYFSFVTLTTVGYGDLAAATGLGRALAIAEALAGQIYLVTVVAVIVSTLAARVTAR